MAGNQSENAYLAKAPAAKHLRSSMGCHEEVKRKRVGSGAKTGRTSRTNHDLIFLKSGHVTSVGCLNIAEHRGTRGLACFPRSELGQSLQLCETSCSSGNTFYDAFSEPLVMMNHV